MEEERIMHYRSSHKTLLVGEGDFSFSLCLAKAFGTAANMVATSLDSRVSLEQKYSSALSNLTELEGFGCNIMHEVDVHTMTQHPLLKDNKFDRIIFNFPHAGFTYREHDNCQIQLHKNLVSGFLANAKHMLNINGEIHVTHKIAYPFNKWGIKELGSYQELFFVGEVRFYQFCYPGYSNKRGDGWKCDESFPIGESSTFKFATSSVPMHTLESRHIISCELL